MHTSIALRVSRALGVARDVYVQVEFLYPSIRYQGWSGRSDDARTIVADRFLARPSLHCSAFGGGKFIFKKEIKKKLSLCIADSLRSLYVLLA